MDEGKGLTTHRPKRLKSEGDKARGDRSGSRCVVVDFALLVESGDSEGSGWVREVRRRGWMGYNGVDNEGFCVKEHKDIRPTGGEVRRFDLRGTTRAID